MHARNDSPDQPTDRGSRRRFAAIRGKAPRTRNVVLATGILVIGITSVGVAATGSPLLQGKRNGTTTHETEIVGNIASSTGLTGGYTTRQSNLSSSGGGAVYGCRSQAGGSLATPTPQNPCVRANNLSKGLAFEFNATLGDVAGAITVGSGGDTKKPFVTNATGVATGLNADRVDNLDAAGIVSAARTGLASLAPFAQVKSDGTLGQTRGLPATGAISHTADSGNYAITFTGDLSKCALSATITGATFGQISADPAAPASANTVVTVHTANSAGAAADRAFDVSATC
jgi:hypothetical protein